MVDEFDGVQPGKFAPEPVESEIGATPNEEYAPFFFPPEGASLMFTFTEEVFLRIVSALRNGAMMTYGEEGPAVYWEFIKQVDYPVPMISCGAIIDCVSNDTDTQEAIQDMLSDALEDPENGFGGAIGEFLLDSGQFTAGLGQTLTPWLNGSQELLSSSVSDDDFWAACVGIARYTNTIISDFLEVMELNTNAVEFVTNGINSVPVMNALIGATGVTQWLEDFDWIQDVLVEQYTAGWTEGEGGTMYAFACQLYCDCIGDKLITFDRIIIASQTLLALYVPVDLQSVVTLMSSVVGVTDEGAPTVWGAFMFTWGLARFMSLAGMQRISNHILKVVISNASEQSEGSFDDHCDGCGPEPRWAWYTLAEFADQGMNYLGHDPDDDSYDLWEVTASNYSGGKFMGYEYGYNVRMSPSVGDYSSNPFTIEIVSTGTEYTQVYQDPGILANGPTYPGPNDPAIWAAEGFRTTAGTMRFRWKPYGS